MIYQHFGREQSCGTFLMELWGKGEGGLYTDFWFSWCQLLGVSLGYWQWHIWMVQFITVSEVINHQCGVSATAVL